MAVDFASLKKTVQSGPNSDQGDLADSEAIKRILNGDRNAFASIVERHGRNIFRLAWRLLGDGSLAEEATQETLTRAFSGLGQFRGECAFRPWLYRILVNICRDLRKAAHRRETPSADPTAGGLLIAIGESPCLKPDENMDRKRALNALQQAIEKLPQAQREAVVMRLLENLPYETISKILGIPTGAVKVRVHRARHRLKKSLGNLLEEAIAKEAT